jgi:hypothetical protein
VHSEGLVEEGYIFYLLVSMLVSSCRTETRGQVIRFWWTSCIAKVLVAYIQWRCFIHEANTDTESGRSADVAKFCSSVEHESVAA